MKKAVIYTRFSPRKNASECDSCETQEHYCRKYAEMQTWEVVAELRDEAKSGASIKGRNGLSRAVSRAKREKGVLLVYSLSRLARSVREALDIADELQKGGADLCSVHEKVDTTSPIGKLFYTMMSALNQFEREQISERTSEAMLKYQKDGRLMGSEAPFGYQEDAENPGTLIPCFMEQEALRLVKAWREEGFGLKKIGMKLKWAGYVPRGKQWYPQTIKRMLKRDY